MRALLLCAGLGTRLRPLTDVLPKPCVPVLDRPLGAYGLGALAAAGVRDVVANTHHLGDRVVPTLAPWADRLGVGLTRVHESTLLGTGGAIRNALPLLGDGDFTVFNGDVMAWPDLGAAHAHHRALGARITLVVRDDPRAARLGAIEVDAAGRVRRILGEGPAPAVPVRSCLFTGVYVVSPALRDDLPREGCVVRHTLRALLARGEPVGAVVDAGPWFDLGTHGAYFGVQQRALREGIAPMVAAAPTARWVGPDGGGCARGAPRGGGGARGGRAGCGGGGARCSGGVAGGCGTGPARARHCDPRGGRPGVNLGGRGLTTGCEPV